MICYICTESDECIPSPCRCKDLYVHKHCILKCIHSLNTTKCTICLAEYNNLICIKKTHYKINTYYLCLFIMCLCLAMLIYAFFYLDGIGDFLTAFFICIFLINFILFIGNILLIIYRRPKFWVKETKIQKAYFYSDIYI